MPFTKLVHELAVFNIDIHIDDRLLLNACFHMLCGAYWLFIQMMPELSTHGTTFSNMSAVNLVLPGLRVSIASAIEINGGGTFLTLSRSTQYCHARNSSLQFLWTFPAVPSSFGTQSELSKLWKYSCLPKVIKSQVFSEVVRTHRGASVCSWLSSCQDTLQRIQHPPQTQLQGVHTTTP